jgi:Fe-S cluster biogenesis protein NfuA
VARLGALLPQLESLPDPRARSAAAETVQALMALYGEGLARMLDGVSRLGAEGLLGAFVADELVSHLLLLHGLHPVDAETRVRRALEEVRPYTEAHGGQVELLEVADGVARLRLQGSCNGCASSADTLRRAIEEAIDRAAPDLERVEIEGAEAEPRPVGSFVALSSLQAGQPPAGRNGG